MLPSKFIESLHKRCRDLARCQKKEDQTKIQARKIAKNLGLEMKITDVEYQGDGSKATFIIPQKVE